MEMYAKWLPKSKPKFALKTCKAYIYQVIHSIQEEEKNKKYDENQKARKKAKMKQENKEKT